LLTYILTMINVLGVTLHVHPHFSQWFPHNYCPLLSHKSKIKNNNILKLNCSTKYCTQKSRKFNRCYIAINTSIVYDPLQKHGQKTGTCDLNVIIPSLNLIHLLTNVMFKYT